MFFIKIKKTTLQPYNLIYLIDGQRTVIVEDGTEYGHIVYNSVVFKALIEQYEDRPLPAPKN